jgi:hypothetical protein
MQHQYKSYTIVITSWGNLDPDGFRPEYRISRKAPSVSHDRKINQTFSTKEEAVDYALQVAKKWIDERGSDHPSTSIERGIDVKRVPLKRNPII